MVKNIAGTSCQTVALLDHLKAHADDAVRLAADSALSIVADIREYHLTLTDVEMLHCLIEAITVSGHDGLHRHLSTHQNCCAMCEQLSLRTALGASAGG